MFNGPLVFFPHNKRFLGCLEFREREQDVIIKPGSTIVNGGEQ